MNAIVISTVVFLVHILVLKLYISGMIPLTDGITLADENLTVTLLFCVMILSIAIYEKKGK